MKKLIYLSVAIVLAACSALPKSSDKTSNDAQPSWIASYPISETHYTGVGFADKSKYTTNYEEVAKKNALQNLVSQIDVTYSEKSLFKLMNNDFNFDSAFKTELQKEAHTLFEKLSLQGVHQERNTYWVYFNLSKSDYEESKQAEMEYAIAKSKSYLQKTTRQYSLKDRYINYVKSIEAIKLFLNESLDCIIDDQKLFLGTEIIAQFRTFLADFRLLSLNKKTKVMVGSNLGEMRFAVEFNKKRVQDIPLIFASDQLNIEPFKNVTDDNGVLTILFPRITSTENTQKFQVGIDISEWLNEASQDVFIQKLARSIKSHQISEAIYIYTPLIYVESKEKQFGVLYRGQELKYATENALVKLGFTPTNDKSAAELFMNIISDTKKDNKLKQDEDYKASLSLEVQVEDRNKLIVFREKIDNITGRESNFKMANTKAYEKAKSELQEIIIPAFVNSFIVQ